MKKIFKTNRFTLVELMMAMAVFTIIAMIMMRFFSSSQQIWNKVSQRNEVYSDARIALDLIARDLQCAFYNNDVSTKGIYPFWFQDVKKVDNTNKYYSDNNFKWTTLNFIAGTNVKENGSASSVCELRYTFVPAGETFINPVVAVLPDDIKAATIEGGWLVRSCTGDIAANDKYNFDLRDNSIADTARMNKIWINKSSAITTPDTPATPLLTTAASFENFQMVIPHVYKLKFTCYSYNPSPEVYDATITYGTGDAVTSAGNIYLSTRDSNIGNNPPSPTDWAAVSAYDVAATYNAGVFVTYNGRVYISKKGLNTGNTPSDFADYWQLYLVGFAPKADSSQYGTYFPLAVKVDISLMSSSDWDRWWLVLNRTSPNPTAVDIADAKKIRDQSMRTFSKIIYINSKASL